MPLDSQAQAMLDIAKQAGLAPLHHLEVHEARRRMSSALTHQGPPHPIFSVKDIAIPGNGGPLRLRVHRPTSQQLLPAVVYLHGGGWVLNDLDTHDNLCRVIATRTMCAVIAIEYRLAPEHRFPAAVNDAIAGTQWIYRNAEKLEIYPDRLAVAGDSAGATLATVVARWAKENNGPSLRCQALLYPVTDHWSTGHQSYSTYAQGYSLSKDLMVWFWAHYLPRGIDPFDVRLCPGRSKDFSKMPPTLIITAEFDPLRDEGEAYAEDLRGADVPVECIRYTGMMHSFILFFNTLDKGAAALAEMVRFLSRYLNVLK